MTFPSTRKRVEARRHRDDSQGATSQNHRDVHYAHWRRQTAARFAGPSWQALGARKFGRWLNSTCLPAVQKGRTRFNLGRGWTEARRQVGACTKRHILGCAYFASRMARDSELECWLHPPDLRTTWWRCAGRSAYSLGGGERLIGFGLSALISSFSKPGSAPESMELVRPESGQEGHIAPRNSASPVTGAHGRSCEAIRLPGKPWRVTLDPLGDVHMANSSSIQLERTTAIWQATLARPSARCTQRTALS